MSVQIKKWGNSASIRIPSTLMASASLHYDQQVEIWQDGDRLIIQPVRAPIYDLDELLAQMQPETFHDEVETGKPVGQEVW